jgi:hypothetical protein
VGADARERGIFVTRGKISGLPNEGAWHHSSQYTRFYRMVELAEPLERCLPAASTHRPYSPPRGPWPPADGSVGLAGAGPPSSTPGRLPIARTETIKRWELVRPSTTGNDGRVEVAAQIRARGPGELHATGPAAVC